MSSRCVSYAFFRHDSSHYEVEQCGESRGRVFLNYLRMIIRAHFAVWEGYDLVFHHDDRVKEFPYFKVLTRAADRGLLKLVDMGKAETLCGSMLWRMRPIWAGTYEVVVCRDVDSVPVPRDRRAVDEFAQAPQQIHAIHDASAHSGIMGGTSAFKPAGFRALAGCLTWDAFKVKQAECASPDDWNKHGKDQNFLNRMIWAGGMKNEVFLHELHHLTDMANQCEMRTRVDWPAPEHMDPRVLAHGDSFTRVIGGCNDVEAPYAFYDKIIGPSVTAIQDIQDIEREVL